MKKYFFLFLIPFLMLSACENGERTTSDNPFFSEYMTPFGVPPFDLVSNDHFIPAFEEGMRQQEDAIDRIVNNPDAPTFANTIEELEYSGAMLSRVSGVFFNFNSSLITPEIQEIAQQVSPMLSNHGDNIGLNAPLFERVRTVYEQREELDLNPEQSRLLEETYKGFARNGALLPEDQQERFREINQELSMLTLEFGQNILGEVNSFRLLIDNEEDLSGLSESVIEAAATLAASEGNEGQWAFTLQNPSVMPFLHNADNRELRQKMQQAYINRGNNGNEYDNNEIIGKIVNLRLERAQMLGYDNHAHFVLEETMAKDIEAVNTFISQVWEPAKAIAEKEADQLQEMIYAQGHDFTLEQWDWRYYTEKVRLDKYDISEEEVRQYFELNTVRDGAFMVANKLWGLQFIQHDDIPKYHEDVQVFEVQEEDGTFIGILYMDFHPRETKRGGAWMSSYRSQQVTQQGVYVHPVITMVCNFTPPSSTMPSLLTYDEMTTLFHEFGHALHGLLSNVTYPGLAGTSVPRDFVELPSQVMENWAREPEVMATFARHYETGEQMPQQLMDRLIAGADFNTGFETAEFLASTYLDMEYHTIEQPFEQAQIQDVANTIEQRTIDNMGLIPQIHFRHASTHFSHIFSGGYSAGYYSYMWSGLLDADVYEAFRETGDFFDQETAEAFRRGILQMGGTEDAMRMYITFRGREPQIEPLLRQRGLLP